MNQKRILYLDVPFDRGSGGDLNRSRFLFNALRDTFDVDLILLGGEDLAGACAGKYYRPVLMLQPKPAPFPRPGSTPSFTLADRERFSTLLRDNKFDAVFGRFATGWELLELVRQISPATAVVVDVDMVSSRLVALAWAANRTFKKRWYLFEKWKLLRFERELFRQPWLFLFTNSTELADVRDNAAPGAAPGEFALLPNIMPRVVELAVIRQPVILFFGSLDSSANLDGFQFLVDELLPQMLDDLIRHDVKIHIAGKNPPAWFGERLQALGTDRVKLVGPVDSIERTIAAAQFVLLPLRIASGTRTRILEAAAVGRAVVTTTIGAEGLDLADTVLIGDTAKDLAAHARHLLASPGAADEVGRRLRERSTSLYAAGKIARDLAVTLGNFMSGRRGGGP